MGDRPGSPSGAQNFADISDGKPGAVTNLDLPLVPGCLAWVKKRSQVTARSLRTVSVTSLWISRAMRPPAPSCQAIPQPLNSLAMQQTVYSSLPELKAPAAEVDAPHRIEDSVRGVSGTGPGA